MLPVLSQKEAFQLDKDTCLSNHLFENQLMENAGEKIAQFIIENIHNPFNKKVIVIAGPGNNGGDAILSHYYLKYYGINSELLLFNDKQKENWIFDKYLIDEGSIQLYNKNYNFEPEYWYVDGIFGIGLKRKVEGIYKHVIDKLKDCPQVISIDIPSGIFCDSGIMAGTNVLADFTLTMGHPKLGHYFNDGLEYSGDIYILDIGFKPLLNPYKFIQQIQHNDVIDLCLEYPKNSHKYNRGKLICIAGSAGYTGAGILAVNAACKTGVGIIKIIVPQSLNTLFETNLIEAITIPLLDHHSGRLSDENINDILDEVKWAEVVLFGPGLISETSDWKAHVLSEINIPLVLDASGFQPLFEDRLNINELPLETILTPHYSEFSRIFNIDIKQVKEDPISSVMQIISLLDGRVLVLKGATNIIVTSEGKVFLMNNGTSDLATAGTGDVLSGILSALIAMGSSIDEAALFGPYLHGECVKQYKNLFNSKGITATELQNMIPCALESLNNVY